MCEFAQHDEKDDEAGDPGPKFIEMDDLVAEKRDEECACCNDDNTSIARDVVINRIQQLRANDGVHGGPANASQHVEERYDLDGVETKEEAREDHLAETILRTKGGEEGDRGNAEHIYEQDGEEGVNEAKVENGDCERADGEGGDYHVGG